MHLQRLRGERARQFAADELLLGRGNIDVVIKRDDCPGISLSSDAQGALGTARQIFARTGVTRRLRVAGMGRDVDHILDPMWLGDRIDRRTQHRCGIVETGPHHGEFMRPGPAAHCACRQRSAQVRGGGGNHLIARALPRILDQNIDAAQREQRICHHTLLALRRERRIEQHHHFVVAVEAGQGVLLERLARLLLAEHELLTRTMQLARRHAGKADQADHDRADQRRKAKHE